MSVPLTTCLSRGSRAPAPLCSSALSARAMARPGRSLASARRFTLLEILTAAAMFAILASALTSVFFATMRLRSNASDRLDEVLPPELVEATIRDDFQALLPPAGVLAGPMLGEKEEEGGFRLDRAEFYAAGGVLRDSTPWGDVLKIEYRLDDSADGSGLSLVRSVTRNLLAEVIEDTDDQVLLSGVQSFQLSYYDGDVWLDSWDSTAEENELPKAIKARVDFLPVDGAQTPRPVEVVTAVLVRASPSQDQTAADGGEEGGGGG